MPDPARLTDEQIEEIREALFGDDPRYPWEHLGDAAQDVRGLLARLAAAENVVEAAREWRRSGMEDVGSYEEGQRWVAAGLAFDAALAAYDAQKEPTGNHAESSATRGDTNE